MGRVSIAAAKMDKIVFRRDTDNLPLELLNFI